MSTNVREYIGSRYVPIFGRKDEESIAWDNTKPYEPLTIVLYQGNSYTSRQYVPIGIEITNQTFWALTGNYNAQVEAYRQEVETYTQAYGDAINALEDALPIASFDSSNTVDSHIDSIEAFLPETVIGFDTVADMKASTILENDMICHTNGFHSVNDGGSAFYKISNSGVANEMDIIACGEYNAYLIEDTNAFIPEKYGAYGDGSQDTLDIFEYIITKFSTGSSSEPITNKIIGNGKYLFSDSLSISLPNQFTFIDFNVKEIIGDFNDYLIKIAGIVNTSNINFYSMKNNSGGCISITASSGSTNWVQYININGDIMLAGSTANCIFIQVSSDGFANEIHISVNRFMGGKYGVYAIKSKGLYLEHCGFEYASLKLDNCNNTTLLACRNVETPNADYNMETVGECNQLLVIGGNMLLLGYTTYFNFSSQTFGMWFLDVNALNNYGIYRNGVHGYIWCGKVYAPDNGGVYENIAADPGVLDTRNKTNMLYPTFVNAYQCSKIILDGKVYGHANGINRFLIRDVRATMNTTLQIATPSGTLKKIYDFTANGTYLVEFIRSQTADGETTDWLITNLGSSTDIIKTSTAIE